MSGSSNPYPDERRSVDPGVSATPTLRDEPLDVDLPLQEKNPKNPNPEAKPDADAEQPRVEPAREVDPRSGDGEDDKDVLIVDWEGPDDPQNPKK